MRHLLLLLGLVACTGRPVDTDTGADTDTGTGADTDTNTDTEAPAYPLAGFGEITGSCPEVDDEEITSGAPFVFRRTLDLGSDPFDDPADAGALTDGGERILDAGNLGGSSLYSEIFAYEVLHRCDGADLLKTEAEIVYDTEGKKTDLLVDLDLLRVGVSVTRAYHHPAPDAYEVEHADALLRDKLADIPEATANVSDADSWEKQVLAILAWDAHAADSIEAALLDLEPAVTGDTIVYVIVTNGADTNLYLND